MNKELGTFITSADTYNTDQQNFSKHHEVFLLLYRLPVESVNTYFFCMKAFQGDMQKTQKSVTTNHGLLIAENSQCLCVFFKQIFFNYFTCLRMKKLFFGYKNIC